MDNGQFFVKSVQDFLTILPQVCVSLSHGRKLFYHGLYNADWNLCANVFRNKGDERTICLDFKQYAQMMGIDYDPYLECDKMLMDMQHYRIPTRMLDWTLNPLVALYFACVEDVYKEGKNQAQNDGLVWIFDPWKYYSNIILDRSNLRIHDAHVIARCLLAYGLDPDSACITVNKRFDCQICRHDLRLPFPVVSVFTNKRKLAQEGCFTIPGINVGDMKELDEFKQNAVSVKIAKDSKDHIRDQLNLIGINDYTIYPDFDGFARQIARDGGIFNRSTKNA